MADHPQEPGLSSTSPGRRDRPPGTPRWVLAFGVAVALVILIFLILHLTGNAPTHGMR